MTCNKDCFNCEFTDCIRPENADAIEQATKWAKDNPEKRSIIRKRYYSKNADKEKAYQRTVYKRIKDDPEYKARKLQTQRERRARKKAEVR